jgi:hypothetical protein
MIYSTDSILYKGAVWPPESEKSRLKLYQQNQDLFEGQHTKVYTGLLRLFHDSAAEHQKIILILNWHRRLSCLWPDLLIGETPDVKVDDANQEAVKELRRDSGLWPEAYKGLLDMSRFGVGPVKIYQDADERVHTQAIAPSKWFPIQDSGGQIVEHLLAWTSDEYIDHIIKSYLQVEIHRRGEVETRKYEYKQGKIASEAYDIEIDDTGIDDFLVVPLLNLTTTTDQWGMDDYTPLDPIIRRLETRLTRLGRILDAHSEPMMGVPEDAITKDPNTGESLYDSNLKVFPMGEGQNPPMYITWDGQLAASFQEITFLMDQLYAISETCPQAFGQSISGTAESGTSLRLRMMAPLKRVERLRLNIDPAIKKIIWLSAQLSGIDLKENEIGIDWHDGLPNDEFQQSQIEVMNVMAGITSKKAAAKRLYRLTDDQADIDQGQMKEELALQGGMM